MQSRFLAPLFTLMMFGPTVVEGQRLPTRSPTASTVDVRTYTARWDEVAQEAHEKGYCTSIYGYTYSRRTAAMALGSSPSVTLHEVRWIDFGSWGVGGPLGEVREGVQVVYSNDNDREYRLLSPAVRCSGAWEMVAPGQIVCGGVGDRAGEVVESSPRLLRDGWTIEAVDLSTPSGFTVERIPGPGDRNPAIRLSRMTAPLSALPPVAGTISGTIDFRGPRGSRWQEAFQNQGRCSF